MMIGSADVLSVSIFAPASSGPLLWLSILATIGGFLTLHRAAQELAPTRPAPAPHAGALRADSPATVNLLANDVTVTAAGFRATMIDLAARGWLRILPPDDQDDELCRIRPAATAYEGDSLLPHERLVLQHVLARFTTDRAIPARLLAVDVRSSWWRRFASLVIDDAEAAGLIRRRWSSKDLITPLLFWVGAAAVWILSWGSGNTDIAVVDSVPRRILSWAVFAALGVLLARLIITRLHPGQTHTERGIAATRSWLAVRQRLVGADFGRLAPSAAETGDRRLAYAAALCLAEGAAIELPLAREDHRIAWSSVGGTARLVRVRYPTRIGYGLAPLLSLGVGVIACFFGLQASRWCRDVAHGEAFDWIYEQFPEQSDLIADVATGLTFLSYAPIAVGLWLALAGAADAFSGSSRTGLVLRTRRPAEVSPLPRPVRRWLERDRFSLFVAIDDGSSDTVVAWRTNERHAVPQGVTATVQATPMLGHISNAAPVGHRIFE